MDFLTLAAGCSLFITIPCSSPTLPPPTLKGVTRWQPVIAEAASTFALPEAWVAAVMASESGGRTVLNGRPITSSAGAMGLMQIMPGTYQDLRKQFGLGSDPHTPRDNILAGTAYLQQMYRRYGYPAMFAAYNAGPGRYEDFLHRRRPLPAETIAYIAGIAPGAEMRFGVEKVTAKSVQSGRTATSIAAKTDSIFFAPSAAKALFVTRTAPSAAQD